MIESLILAAGLSKRMGEQKLLLPFGDKTIIEAVIDSAAGSKANRILVVLGSDREKIEKQIESAPVRTVYNPCYKEGMLSSVQCGLGAVMAEAKAVVILLGDQPSIAPGTINKIVDAYHKSKKGIVLPVFNNRRGHPVLIDLKYREEVSGLGSDIGLRQLIRSHPEDIEEVAVESPAIHQDIDTRDDYRTAVTKLNSPD